MSCFFCKQRVANTPPQDAYLLGWLISAFAASNHPDMHARVRELACDFHKQRIKDFDEVSAELGLTLAAAMN